MSKYLILIPVFFIFCVVTYGQNHSDVETNDKIVTVKNVVVIEGTIMEFCNGLSLDFGEHPGLLIVRESKTDKIYNVLLNPYRWYNFKKNEVVKVTVLPFTPYKNSVKNIEPMCKSIGNIFVQKKLSRAD